MAYSSSSSSSPSSSPSSRQGPVAQPLKLSNPNIRFGDMRYTSDEPTNALWGFIKTTPLWETLCQTEHNDCRGTKRYRLRSGAANLMRYTGFYHTLRARYLALHRGEPYAFEASKIFDSLRKHLNEDYALEKQEEMAVVWCLLSKWIEKEARRDFFISPSKFPLEVQIGGRVALNKFLGILIDLVITDLVIAPGSLGNLGWDGLDEAFYERAMANEGHQGFFTGPVTHPDSPSFPMTFGVSTFTNPWD